VAFGPQVILPLLFSEELRTSFLVRNQRNEADEFAKGIYKLPVELADEMELLRVGRPDGDDHSTAVAELSGQSGRDTERGSGDEDVVERCAGMESERAIAGKDADIRVAKGGEKLASALG
jgi:hypothetical protein